MHFHQVLNEDLRCASYLLASESEAIVVDPRWDVDVYLELAGRAGARITHVLDTHDHADHVSGRGRLARRSGGRAHRPVDFRPGDELRAGDVRLTALAAAGHRPEHLAFLVHDVARSAEPVGVLTGDSLLVGDVARPDLAVEPRAGARALHATVGALLALPDHVAVWPAHVGGSLCAGAGLDARTTSTVGFERRAGLSSGLAEPEFVARVTSALPPRPPNLQAIVARNQGLLEEAPATTAWLDVERLSDAVRAGLTVLDHRPAEAFDRGHLAGAVSAPPSTAVATRVGWAAAPDEPVVVVAGAHAEARAFVSLLHSIGIWEIHGVALADPWAWAACGLAVRRSGAWEVERLAAALREERVALLDVRDTTEFAAGHVPGSHHAPLHALATGDGVPGPAEGPLAVACAAGSRAALGASLLRRAGRRDVVRVGPGGIPDLAAHGVELSRAA